jgi:hypothetical protein
MELKTGTKNVIFVVGVTLVVGTLTLLSGSRTKRYVPVDEHHPRPLAVELCRDCHAPGKMAPQPASHPPKEKCLLCHRDKKI